MLPNYLVIGAAKCGTSSLCHLLGLHPDVFMSTPKEIHYFGRDDPEKTMAWYESMFEGATGSKAIGEGSTSYTHPDIIEACAAEIARDIPKCRLIYMVRNPIDRLESDWKMRRHDGWSADSINDAVERQPTLITLGLYWRNLGVYRRYFPDEQILVGFLEDFARQPEEELKRCFRHLGVDPEVIVENPDRARNASAGYRRYGRLASTIRGSGVFRAVRRHLPEWMMSRAKSALTEQVKYTPEWDPEVRAAAISSLADDARQFLAFYGRDPDLWATVTAPENSVRR